MSSQREYELIVKAIREKGLGLGSRARSALELRRMRDRVRAEKQLSSAAEVEAMEKRYFSLFADLELLERERNAPRHLYFNEVKEQKKVEKVSLKPRRLWNRLKGVDIKNFFMRMLQSRDRKALDNIRDSLEIVNKKLDEILIEFDRLKDTESPQHYHPGDYCIQEPMEEIRELQLEDHEEYPSLFEEDCEDNLIFMFDDYSRSASCLSPVLARQQIPSYRCQTL